MLTLKDVAAEAGVSISTVSLVLNNVDAGRVRTEQADRIRRIARDMGYVPNVNARGLATSRSRTIGVLSDTVASTPFAGQLLAGAHSVAHEAGYVLLIVDTDDHPGMEKEAIATLVQRNIEGLIYAVGYHRSVTVPTLPSRIPVEILNGFPGRSEDRAGSVVPDERRGARDVTRELIRMGHRRIGMCSNSQDMPAVALRLAGFRDALIEAGVPFDPELVVHSRDASTVASIDPARELLGRADRPTGVFCFGDQIAFGFYQVAHELGLGIPHDVSIVGFDNQAYIADALRPGLTTAALPYRAMGEHAARSLISRIHREREPEHTRLACPVVQRGSVAPPAAHRTEVTEFLATAPT